MFKKLQVIVFVFLITNLLYSADNHKLLGKWEGISNTEEVIKIEFFEDGYTDLYKGQSGLMNGKVTAAVFFPKYILDTSKTPFALDFEYYKSKGEIDRTIMGIVEFVNDNEIKIALPVKLDERTKSFKSTDYSEIWKLKKIIE